MLHKIKFKFMEVKIMKKNEKNINQEAIYASQSIKKVTKIFFNILEILKNKKVISFANFLYGIEKLEFFYSNHENFNYIIFGTKNPKDNIVKKNFVNKSAIEERLLQQKLNILLKYFEKKNQIKFKKMTIEILDYMQKIYNQNIGDLLDMIENEKKYEIVPLSDIFILIAELKDSILLMGV